jgi:hypothetical protein
MNLGKAFDRFVLIIALIVAGVFTGLGFVLGALLT